MRAEDRRRAGGQRFPVFAYGQVFVVGGEEVEGAQDDDAFDRGFGGGEEQVVDAARVVVEPVDFAIT